MRRVVGTVGNTLSTQYRMVEDHLGSTSLIVDAQNTPVVVQRTYNKPYGEVAWSWSPSGGGPTSLTSVGYTGQRLEGGAGESGLMDYNARFYDPVLSYFVSADTVAPGKRMPGTRNRYSYVSNSPLSLKDPSGHYPTHLGDGSGVSRTAEEQAKYDADVAELKELGIDLDEGCDACAPFDLEDVEEILEAMHLVMAKAGWKTAEDFRKYVGTDSHRISIVSRASSPCDPPNASCASVGGLGDRHGMSNTTITLVDMRQRRLDEAAGGVPADRAKLNRLATIIHEFAHAWDNNQARALSNGLSRMTQYPYENAPGRARYPNMEEPVSDYGRDSAQEDFAEAVTAVVLEDYPDSSKLFPNYDSGSQRALYVHAQFDGYYGRIPQGYPYTP